MLRETSSADPAVSEFQPQADSRVATKSFSPAKWKWGIIAAAVMTLITLIPQVSLWRAQGGAWNGLYAMVHTDEPAYSAYINALISGRPRRNDPYTGRDDSPTLPQPESLFSIQFIPAYAIAWPARMLGLSAASAFIALTIISSLLSALALFWLIHLITGDEMLAAAGALAVLCFGTMAGGYGEIRGLLGLQAAGAGDVALPFLRRYLPALVFPLFFIFCGLVWRAAISERQRQRMIAAIAAGVTFAVLIFSYFFLWTAAAAWLAGLVALSLVARSHDRKRIAQVVAIVVGVAVAALIPYLMLIARRADSLDSTQALAVTHLADFSRVSEQTGLAVLIVLIVAALCRLINRNAPATLFAASFALMPIIAFNQQVITGRVLQPIHYELFIANYAAVLAAVLTFALVRHRLSGKWIVRPALLLIALVAVCWGVIEAAGVARRNAGYAKSLDDYLPVLARLKELSKTDITNTNAQNPRPIVMTSDLDLADLLPTVAPQAVVWSLHMPVYAGLRKGESKERFYYHLYYSGVTEEELGQAIADYQFALMAALFGYERALPALSPNAKPVTQEDVRAELNRYSAYVSSFNRQRAEEYPLAYVVTSGPEEKSLARIDRWYERDAGERIGRWMIYRVKLRQ